MSNIYSGDPRIFIGQNGAYLDFRGGQPVMDAGLENGSVISLFTREGWSGNALFPDNKNHIGSKFEAANEKTITRRSLLDRQDAAEKALRWMIDKGIASDIRIDITNPNSYRVNMSALISPPSGDVRELLLTRNGVNWQEQAINPAHLK